MSRRRFARNAGILSFSLLVVLVALLAVDLLLIALVHFLQDQARDDLSTSAADQATVATPNVSGSSGSSCRRPSCELPAAQLPPSCAQLATPLT